MTSDDLRRKDPQSYIIQEIDELKDKVRELEERLTSVSNALHRITDRVLNIRNER